MSYHSTKCWAPLINSNHPARADGHWFCLNVPSAGEQRRALPGVKDKKPPPAVLATRQKEYRNPCFLRPLDVSIRWSLMRVCMVYFRVVLCCCILFNVNGWWWMDGWIKLYGQVVSTFYAVAITTRLKVHLTHGWMREPNILFTQGSVW